MIQSFLKHWIMKLRIVGNFFEFIGVIRLYLFWFLGKPIDKKKYWNYFLKVDTCHLICLFIFVISNLYQKGRFTFNYYFPYLVLSTLNLAFKICTLCTVSLLLQTSIQISGERFKSWHCSQCSPRCYKAASNLRSLYNIKAMSWWENATQPVARRLPSAQRFYNFTVSLNQTFLCPDIKFLEKDSNPDIAVSAVPGVTRQLQILGPYTTLKPWAGKRTPHSQLQGNCLLPNAYRFQTNLPQHRVE